MDTIYRTYTITVRHWRKSTEEEQAAGARASIHLPDTLEQVSIEVDLEALARDLGDRACRSARGRASGLSNRVVVKRLKVLKVR